VEREPKIWGEGGDIGPTRIAEEGEKNQEGGEENHQNLLQFLSKNHVVIVTSLSYVLFWDFKAKWEINLKWNDLGFLLS
jgi:hypothetical protein